ncbi:MAG: hypothetical protein A2845_03105 [Candidatus Lloydbacteria bacterium RIFCSPHIGHO2_01_FULL_49_22]|uniref:Sortase n=1 Tax=Candidatus Lloydbacteria bacterium RIFCSPHIGHO2_01_FULL_49_22 TaxID=1798658 RepID=A0A1G2CV88_9BACT|nr:MAG: hypothetical protein A2845_03105 [Candidatus Lloydbacteria bacterium RIFCSPHIGHO2_01_FULL_49_22]OGZ10424.1 MAG: hypothetical protein A3C14_02800 [Candidatus Lloydbacteria bacterium RIFCSPHIGHO2_02_FULL_50_18]
MQSKKSFKRSFVALSIVGVGFVVVAGIGFFGRAFFARQLLQNETRVSQHPIAVASIADLAYLGEQSSVGFPIRLKIPKINVDAAFEFVGVTPDGAMAVPKGPNDVAWFEFGPRPGEVGSSVVAGHYGWKNGIPAVFDDLNKLQSGDKLSVVDDKNTMTTFVVREVRTYKENSDAGEVFGSSDGRIHLNLITCGGVWNKAKKSYADRLIVFTDKEAE